MTPRRKSKAALLLVAFAGALVMWAAETAASAKADDETALDARLAVRAKDRMEFRSAGDRTETILNGRPIIPKIYKTSGTQTRSLASVRDFSIFWHSRMASSTSVCRMGWCRARRSMVLPFGWMRRDARSS